MCIAVPQLDTSMGTERFSSQEQNTMLNALVIFNTREEAIQAGVREAPSAAMEHLQNLNLMPQQTAKDMVRVKTVKGGSFSLLTDTKRMLLEPCLKKHLDRSCSDMGLPLFPLLYL